MRKPEDGVAVVIAIAVTALLMMVSVIGAGVVALVAAHRQVQAAADLAALAGASATQAGGSACVAAARVASRNGSELLRCQTNGPVVVILVSRQLPRSLGGRTVRARARAGPAQ